MKTLFYKQRIEGIWFDFQSYKIPSRKTYSNLAFIFDELSEQFPDPVNEQLRERCFNMMTYIRSEF
jgi:hypothetical protein